MKRTLYICALALAIVTQAAVAQTKLNRHVVAVPQSASGSNYLVSWRMLDTDDDYTTFDVIKNGSVVASDINHSTNWLDKQGSKTAKYQIVTKKIGEVVSTTEAVTPWQGAFATLKLDRPADVTTDFEYIETATPVKQKGVFSILGHELAEPIHGTINIIDGELKYIP